MLNIMLYLCLAIIVGGVNNYCSMTLFSVVVNELVNK